MFVLLDGITACVTLARGGTKVKGQTRSRAEDPEIIVQYQTQCCVMMNVCLALASSVVAFSSVTDVVFL